MTTVICRYCKRAVRAYGVNMTPAQHYQPNGAICPGSLRR